MNKQLVSLTTEDKKYINELLSQGSGKIRVYKRAMALKKLDEGLSYATVSAQLDVTYQSVSKWAGKYESEGISCLLDKPRSGRPIVYDEQAVSKITALACSQAPEGYGRWSLRLLADKIVELELLPHVSYSEVRRVLKKTNYNPIERNNGV